MVQSSRCPTPAGRGSFNGVRVDVVSKEYPPEVYGGAGGAGTAAYADLAELEGANGAVKTMGVDLAIVPGCEGTDLVHSHTWYANFAGHVASLLYAVPHVITAHSLEPLRPWKAEQLGGGHPPSS